MGGGQYKKSPCGDIFVQLHQNTANIGSYVSGDVFLNVHTPGFPGNTITFCTMNKLMSQNIVQLTVISYSIRSVFLHPFKMGTYLIIFLTNMILRLNPGQYQFPFQIPLHNLNYTSVDFRHHSMEIRVQFFVKAQVQNYQKIKLDEKIKHKVELNVNRSYYNIERPFTTPKDINCKTCCCIDRGQIQIQPNLTHTDFLYGQIVPVRFTLDTSQSHLTIERILVRFGMAFKAQINGYMRKATYVYQELESPSMFLKKKPLI